MPATPPPLYSPASRAPQSLLRRLGPPTFAAAILAILGASGCSESDDGSQSPSADAAGARDAGPRAIDAAPQLDAPSGPACQAGEYVGPFTGNIVIEGEQFAVNGDVELTLVSEGDGEFLDIVGGSISGLALGVFPFEGELNGKLNCGSALLEDGTITNASVTVFEEEYFFEGTLGASYERFQYRFVDGTWDGEQTGGGPPYDSTGAGSWSAELSE